MTQSFSPEILDLLNNLINFDDTDSDEIYLNDTSNGHDVKINYLHIRRQLSEHSNSIKFMMMLNKNV